MNIEKLILHQIEMTMKTPFTTSFGTTQVRRILLVEAVGRDGVCGWGESVSGFGPWYNEETVTTNEHIIRDYLAPLLSGCSPDHPSELSPIFRKVRRNYMAKAAVENAVWDLYAKRLVRPLWSVLGGERRPIPVGISIGIQESSKALLKVVGRHVEEGYRRIKLKVKPGWDLDILAAVRDQFPRIALMADANSAYTLAHMDHLMGLDRFDLTMVEQPLAHDDIVDHAVLQEALNTPVCLDESIHSVEDVRKALDLGSCRVINIKNGRVGGLSESMAIHDYCRAREVPVWCGGMLESGIGRAHNVGLTSLPGFTLPGDTAASARYWEEDIIEPEVTVDDGLITPSDRPGIGYEVRRDRIEKQLVSRETIGL